MAPIKLPERGILGAACASSIRRCSTRPSSTTPSARSRRAANGGSRSSAAAQLSTVTYPFNPLDAVGWKGNLARRAAQLARHPPGDEPSLSSAAVSVHSTFVADRFVVCTFVPRPIESDPGALKVPFFHSNDDFDEVIFYHAGRVLQPRQHPSRHGDVPSQRLHPWPASQGASRPAPRPAKTMTDEVAVMIDARDALDIGRGRRGGTKTQAYADSWKPK